MTALSLVPRRNRWVYGALLVGVIAAGLLSRSRFATHLPSFIATYAGDTLWALALFVGLAWLFVGWRTSVIAALTVATAFSVEFSQLYQADWINAIRSNRLGALFLGVGFKLSDLPCYVVGTVLGVIVDWSFRRLASCRGSTRCAVQ